MTRFSKRMAVAVVLAAALGTARGDDVVEPAMKRIEAARKKGDYADIVRAADLALGEIARDGKVRLDHEVGPLYLERCIAHNELNHWKEAVADARKAKALLPDDLRALNQAAWLTAVAPDAKLRDGPYAALCADLLMKKLDEELGGLVFLDADDEIASYYDTAAAAYAEAGDFKKAVGHQLRAYEMIVPKGTDAAKLDKKLVRLASQLRARLELYRDRKPYHER